MFSELESARRSVSIRRVVAHGPAAFRDTFQQQDASECLLLILEEVERWVDGSTQKDLLREILAAELQVETRTVLKCAGCKHEHSVLFEKNMVHQLDCSRELAMEWTDEVFRECERCSSTTALQHHTILKLPELLTLHMKRYQAH